MLDGAEWDGVEQEHADVAGGCRVFLAEVRHKRGCMDILGGLPRVMFTSKSLPMYQEFELSAEHATVEYFPDFPLFISFDKDRKGWGLSATSRDRIRGSR